MSQDEPVSGKTRRRFLADLLFLGGGVTAASLLARSTLLDENPPAPEVTATPEPQIPVDKTVDLQPRMPVKPDGPYPGEMVMPEEPQVDGNVVAPQECEPQVEGRTKMPVEPNPAGGARPIKSELDG